MQNKKNLFIDAMSQSLVQSMQKDKNVIILGEGVTDVKGIFNTTNLALKKFGPKRVVESCRNSHSTMLAPSLRSLVT